MGEQTGRSTGRQSVRQAARRAVLDAQSTRRRERAEREQRVEALVVEVLVAIRERDAALATAEGRAGDALDRMVQQERLTVREVVEWCGDDELTNREVTRLRAVAARSGGGTSAPSVDRAPLADQGADDQGADDQGAAVGGRNRRQNTALRLRPAGLSGPDVVMGR